ncbi:MAG: ferritin-like domain-containing protein [Myxococcales bacterium]|nr:ferritin-like domain-containing protein [Myxococcales bacterium]
MTHARDSKTWWREIRDDAPRFARWLLDQLRGERTASERILALRDEHATSNPRAFRLLTVIAAQERDHASWVEGLLRARGIDPATPDTQERYWPHTIKMIDDLETGCAVGAHAEAMRLERIEAIVEDDSAPEDVRAVFAKILPQERFHERAFRSLATEDALEKTRDAHELGRLALGLHP